MISLRYEASVKNRNLTIEWLMGAVCVVHMTLKRRKYPLAGVHRARCSRTFVRFPLVSRDIPRNDKGPGQWKSYCPHTTNGICPLYFVHSTFKGDSPVVADAFKSYKAIQTSASLSIEGRTWRKDDFSIAWLWYTLDLSLI